MKNKVTLKDISDIAGISVVSVSKALKDSPSISKEMKLKVNQIANDLGYVKDYHALTLRGNRFNVIALVYDNLNNPYYSAMLECLHNCIEEAGYESMIFVDHHSLGHLSEFVAKRIVSYGVSGILTFLSPTIEAKKILNNNNMPIVLVGRNGKTTETTSVYSNDKKGGKLAAEVLVKLGGKHFCYVTEHSELQINTDRLNGFKSGLQEHNISLKKENIIVGNLEVNAYDELEKRLKREKIDSIFCFSDLIALNVVSKLVELNYRVPEDINVIGYDNIKSSLPYPMKISSIDADKKTTSEIALNLLIDQINGYKEKKYLKIDVVFSKGTSTK